MIIKESCKSNIPIQNLNNVYVVADFDRTITEGNSDTSWSILSKSDCVPKSYVQERQAFYDYYRPIETDETIDLNLKMEKMKEWYLKHVSLFVKYQIKKDVFEKAATDLRVMRFRPGVKEFIEFLHKNTIPLIIISAGIGNFIETFLTQNNCYLDNVYISSNMIEFENGVAVGVGKNIIHSLNKNEVSLPEEISKKLEGRNGVILLGDQVTDLNMVDKSRHDYVINVGLHVNDYPAEAMIKNYDIYCEKGDDYFSIKEVLFEE